MLVRPTESVHHGAHETYGFNDRPVPLEKKLPFAAVHAVPSEESTSEVTRVSMNNMLFCRGSSC